MNYDDDKGAYTFIVGIIIIAWLAIIVWMPFFIVFGIILGFVGLVLYGIGEAYKSYDDNVKPKIDKWLDD